MATRIDGDHNVSRWHPRRIKRAMRYRIRQRALTARRSVALRVREKALDDRRWTTLYYLLEGSMDRELHAVLKGMQAHDPSGLSVEDARADADAFTLRRNVHRLEKGLLMRPRRSTFALDYIGETVEAYERSVGVADVEMLAWASDVLAEYFATVGEDERVAAAQTRYEMARVNCDGIDRCRRVPYQRDTTPLRITIDDFEALARRRRSVRWFLPEPVSREVTLRALGAALQSPSACNRQPFRIHVFDDPEMVRRVAEVPMGTKGYVENIPSVAVIVGRQRAFYSERDRHLIYIDGALAAMSFMYALEVQGIASCPINWPDLERREQAMAKLLGLEADERPVMLVAFGHPDPDGMVAYSQKKSITEVSAFNQLPGLGSKP